MGNLDDKSDEIQRFYYISVFFSRLQTVYFMLRKGFTVITLCFSLGSIFTVRINPFIFYSDKLKVSKIQYIR